jgi:hypothetical protein
VQMVQEQIIQEQARTPEAGDAGERVHEGRAFRKTLVRREWASTDRE